MPKDSIKEHKSAKLGRKLASSRATEKGENARFGSYCLQPAGASKDGGGCGCHLVLLDAASQERSDRIRGRPRQMEWSTVVEWFQRQTRLEPENTGRQRKVVCTRTISRARHIQKPQILDRDKKKNREDAKYSRPYRVLDWKLKQARPSGSTCRCRSGRVGVSYAMVRK
jgi:hypothetical protein